MLYHSRIVLRAATSLVAVMTFSLLITGAAGAATPASGTVAPANPSVSWDGPAKTAETAGPSKAQCAPDPAEPELLQNFCDDFILTVDVPATYWNTHQGGVQIDLTGISPAEDFDLYVFDKTGGQVGSSGNPGGVESVYLPCASHTGSPYVVRAVYFTTVDEGLGLPGYRASAQFQTADGECETAAEAEGGPATFVNNALTFAPATITSAHFLGAEPQVTIERRMPYTPTSAGIDPNRIFVDWPLSSRSGIGQLNRSLDGGDTFRLLFDRLCANRSRPNCLTHGGGDTENDVNYVSGNLYFSDQEVLANEALATSYDHGDSFLAQTAVANATSASDRQWIATTDNAFEYAPTKAIEGFLVYHVVPQQYIQAIDQTGAPIPQPVGQLTNVAQSGQLRVDNNASSPGHGWIYQPHIGFSPGGTYVGTAHSSGYANPLSWQDNKVSGGTTTSFPWVAIDDAGNAFIVWDNGGVVYLSYAAINDPANNPVVGGRPGTKWSPKVRVTPSSVGSAVFPEVTAGSAGRIGITYVGTEDWTGEPDNAPDDAEWHTYAAVIPDALSATPSVNTGIVTHRAMHIGNVCTSGTTCVTTGKDRSLLDMIDISFDEDGRLGIITMDNNSDSFHAAPGGTEDEGPFAHFTKQTSGLSVLAGKTINVSVPTGARADTAGDATWPNQAGASNLPSLDILNSSLGLENGQVVARLRLADAGGPAFARDLAAYNADLTCQPVISCQAERLQIVVRFMSGREIHHLSMDVGPDGVPRYFGGTLDGNDKLEGSASPTAVFAAGYHTDFTATGVISGGELVIRAPASGFGLGAGSALYSVTGFSMAGPNEANEILIDRIMRTVDASPPFDANLAEADLSLTKTDSPDPVPAGGNVTYTLTAANNGPSAATGVTITDTLPASVTFVSASSGCANSGGTVTCTIGTLASGATASRTITGRTTEVGTFTNTATVAGDQFDPNPTNNTASASTTVTAAADLAVTVTDAPDPAQLGQPLRYTIVVTNYGPSPASGVTLTVLLPKNAGYSFATTQQGKCTAKPSKSTVTCSIGTMVAGASVTVIIEVKPTAKGQLVTTASVKATSPADPNQANNAATATTTVQ